ncbi:oxygen-dependent coproporphyrinogen oxidase [Hymenobacter terrigena]
MAAPDFLLSAPPRVVAERWMQQLQDEVCRQLALLDGSGQAFERQDWQQANGHGCIRVLQHGDVLEKGGVAFSAVRNELEAATARQLSLPTAYFLVRMHAVQFPRNPWVPIAHLSMHYVEAENGEAWFGGSLDLTPVYVDRAQAHWFHAQLAALCQAHNAGYYARFKAAADNYFYLPHRQATLGIGGLYFDHLMVDKDGSFAQLFTFVRQLGLTYPRLYGVLMHQNADRPYHPHNKSWQVVRWGHCAEFSLLLDRDTRLGLATGVPLESILLSLPPQAEWPAQLHIGPTSTEAQTQLWLHPGVNWLAPNPEPPEGLRFGS